MKKAGIFSLSMPRAWGGPEVDPLTQIRVVEALSMADGSVGWAAMLGLHAGYFAAFLDEGAARKMYVDLDAFTGGVTRPTGKAVVVPGGYQVTGRWTFGSCCEHSVWLFSNCVVIEDGAPRVGPDGAPETRLCYLPGEAVEVIDTWTATGLRGTGSHDYSVTDLFVPAERTFDLLRSPSRRSEPLYRLRNMYLANLSGIPLGIGRAAIDSVVALARGKQTRIGTALRDEAYVHAAIARAEVLVGSARAFVFDVMGEIWAGLIAGHAVSPGQQARYRLSICNAYDACVEAVDLMYRTGSGTSLYASHPLDRYFRDIHAASQHFVVSTKIAECAGRVLLGLPPNVPTF